MDRTCGCGRRSDRHRWMKHRSAKEPASSRRLVMVRRLGETCDVDAVCVRDPTTGAEASKVAHALPECPRKNRRANGAGGSRSREGVPRMIRVPVGAEKDTAPGSAWAGRIRKRRRFRGPRHPGPKRTHGPALRHRHHRATERMPWNTQKPERGVLTGCVDSSSVPPARMVSSVLHRCTDTRRGCCILSRSMFHPVSILPRPVAMPIPLLLKMRSAHGDRR